MESSNNKQQKIEIVYPKKPRRDPQADRNDKKIMAICNLRQINLGEEKKKVIQYAIHYDPPIADENYPLKRSILKTLRKDLNGFFEKCFPAGDTIFVYDSNPKEKVELEAKVEETNYKVLFIKSQNFINCRNIRSKAKDQIKIKGFVESLIKNIIFANNHIVRFSDRSFFDYKDVETFGRNRASMWHGYSTAICITEDGLSLRINDKNKLVTGKTAFMKMQEIAKHYGNNMNNEECHREIAEYFKGKTVIATYGSYRAYRIGDVSFDKTISNTEFTIEKEGTKVSVTIDNYYKTQYKIDIRNKNQPLLVEEVPKRELDNPSIRYIIPELVYLTGVDELDENDKAEVIKKSKLQPAEKVKRITHGLSYIENEEKKHIKRKDKEVDLPSPNEIRREWGISIENNFVQVEARCLPIPQLEFGNGKENIQLRNGRFRQQKDYRPLEFNDQNCMLITFDGIQQLAKGDCDQMSTAGRNLGVRFSLPKLEKIHSHKNKEDVISGLKRLNYNDGKIMVIVVLDRSTKHLYPEIKNYLYTQGGLPSQVMLHDENPRGGRKKQNLSYYSAVLNQMVVKAQGELFKIGFCQNISSTPSMIIGIDSSRQKTGTKYILSASFNRSFNKFYTDFKVDSGNYEALKDLVKNALDYFKKVNNDRKPQSIIIYRQGGNERQNDRLKTTEVPKIVEFLDGGYEADYKPKVTIFSVNKNTDLKFFERSGNGYRNLPSGSVIDQKVISPDTFEFYLQCPDVDKGTGSPVHFFCLHNTNENLTYNEFEEITYLQSFYYWNWCGPIRVPAALKYAEVANQFSSRNLKAEVIDKLKNCPYFI